MVTFSDGVTYFLSFLALVSTLLALLYVFDMVYYKLRKKLVLGTFWKHLDNNAVFYIFLVSALSVGGSLTLSELLQFVPCVLCWWQRIFMYPIFVITIMAYFVQDKKIVKYAGMLAFVGILFSAYHYYHQMTNTNTVACDVIGYSASCSESFFVHFGYITIPFMALIAFLLVLLLWHNNAYKFYSMNNTKKSEPLVTEKMQPSENTKKEILTNPSPSV